MFFLQFAEFNLKAPPYSKTLITQELPYSRAPTLFRSIYSQDRKNSSSVNVALEKCKILTFLFNFFLLLRPLYSEEPWRASCPLRKVIKASLFFHISVQINFSSTINMQRKGSMKSLPCSGLLLPFYELMKLGVLAKWTFKWP